MSVSIQFGYVNSSGVNDALVVSPSNKVSGTALRDLVVNSLAAAGSPTLIWVDGSPNSLVTAVATRLKLPQGMPETWFSPEVETI